MLHGLALKAGRPTTAAYVASAAVAFPGGAFALTGQGLKSGDLLVGWAHSTSSTMSVNGVGLTPIAGAQGRFFLRILTQQDIDTGGSMSTGGWWMAFRGPQTGALRSSNTRAGGGPTLAGFTKSPFSGVLVYGGAATGATADPAVSGTGWINLGHRQSSQNYVSAGYNLPVSNYTDGASITTSGSSNGSTSGSILELTF